jgi:hypothetical protein
MTSTNLENMVRIHNQETGEIIDRPMNEDELAQKAKDASFVRQ